MDLKGYAGKVGERITLIDLTLINRTHYTKKVVGDIETVVWRQVFKGVDGLTYVYSGKWLYVASDGRLNLKATVKGVEERFGGYVRLARPHITPALLERHLL